MVRALLHEISLVTETYIPVSFVTNQPYAAFRDQASLQATGIRTES
jgi:hypothetical protein